MEFRVYFYVFSSLDFHRFRIKLLIQYPHLHCYSYESGLYYLLNQLIYYLIYEVTTSTTFVSVLSFFTY